jgi:TamB, inner membrane protein subunit of TAM complex
LKKFLKILRNSVISMLALFALAGIAVNLPPVQTYLVREAAKVLSEKIKTPVTVKHVSFSFLNHLDLEGVYLEDQHKDTLLYIGKLETGLTDFILHRTKTVIKYLKLEDACVKISKPATADVWNFDFIFNAFQQASDTSKSNSTIDFKLRNLILKRVRFVWSDKWTGMDVGVSLTDFNVATKDINVAAKTIDISKITLNKSLVWVDFYKRGRPGPDDTISSMINIPLNSGWIVNIGKTQLNECAFNCNLNTGAPQPDGFDPFHIKIAKIDLDAERMHIVGDTITGVLKKLKAKERCGFEIRQMQALISVSPNASICKNLLLVTNRSRVKNYFAMHYRWFPNFLQYNDSVVMDGNVVNSEIDSRDIAFFAPPLKTLPQAILKGSFSGKGAVANLSGNIAQLTDGFNSISGDVTLVGLPDIFKTDINFRNGKINTSGNGILKYAPLWVGKKDFDLSQIAYATFVGGFSGYIEDFIVSGNIQSNLGNIAANFSLAMPKFNADSAKYYGILATDSFEVGKLLNRPEIGYISINDTFDGTSFNPENAQILVDGTMQNFTFQDYAYHNIITNGTLARKKFSGFLSIKDSNLDLTFNGDLDYNHNNLKLQAKALVRNCNLRALNLIRDSIIIDSTDLDLNCIGTNIDNFFGYAILNNIDIKKNNKRFSLDSIYIHSSGDSESRYLKIVSNDVNATLSGTFFLSQLPATFQWYFSKYVPNYVKPPDALPNFHDFEFTVKTKNIDKFLQVAFNGVKGFNHASLTGKIDMPKKKLEMNLKVPDGTLGNVRFLGVNFTGRGDLDSLGCVFNASTVSIGDSAINATLQLTAMLQHDSLHFNIASSTPDTGVELVLDGGVVASHDSLYFSLAPSALVLNKAKWDVSGNCKAIYADKYLYIDNFLLSSGLQKIRGSFTNLGPDDVIYLNFEDIDLGQLGNYKGISYYQPDGRLNGMIQIFNPLKNPYFKVGMSATNVKLINENVGTVNVFGEYDAGLRVLKILKETGIYNGNSSLATEGSLNFQNKALEGKIQLNNTRLSLMSPFVVGLFSRITGTLNGNINISGTSLQPEISGDVVMEPGGMKVDYSGCSYTFQQSNIHLNNSEIIIAPTVVKDEHGNTGKASGFMSHKILRDFQMDFCLRTNKLQVLKTGKNDNPYFYGNVVAGLDSFTVTGSFNNVFLKGFNVYPAAKSNLVIPVTTTGDVGSYSFISFKTYDKKLDASQRISQNKINVSIDARPNPLANVTILLDPASGDAIVANGEGNILLNMPANNDMSITGYYKIESGLYSFLFKQLQIKKQFILQQGSKINFNGPFGETTMDVFASYPVKTRLYDLLSETEKATALQVDITDAKRLQTVNVLLHMEDHIMNPKLTFDLSMEDKGMGSNVAYNKLLLINQNDRQKFDQVASLLLTNNFIPPDGLLGSSTLATGALNNVGQLLSGATSAQLTNLVTKMIGERQVNINVNYQSYYFNDLNSGSGSLNRNQITTTISKNYFDDRLTVELGGKSDWGRQSGSSTNSSYNISGDFRLQYQISALSKMRLTCFRTSDYDATLDRQIVRGGVGLSWKKSFDNLPDFFTSGTNNTSPGKKTEKEPVNKDAGK